MRTVDITKKANIKCEHCKYFTYHLDNYGKCSELKEKKNYWNRCKSFQWKDEYLNER